MPGTFSLPLRVRDPDIHHGTCMADVPSCIPGSLTIAVSVEGGGGETFPGSPGTCTTRSFTYLLRGPLVELRTYKRHLDSVVNDLYRAGYMQEACLSSLSSQENIMKI